MKVKIDRKNKNVFYLISIIFVFFILSFMCYKVISHEKWQSQQIHLQIQEIDSQKQQIDLQKQQIESLSELIEKIQEERKQEKRIKSATNAAKKINFNSTSYNYLALGNSITIHGKCDYWWNDIGMAATSEEHDYFHIVKKHLEETHNEVIAFAYNYYIWEVNGHDRQETYGIIDAFLEPSLDLVTIQLSENASDLSTFEVDYIELINHIKDKCPKADIILIDDFWNDDKSQIKKNVANKTKVKFVSLKKIRGDKEYQCNIGTTVYGDDGSEHIVEHDGVAGHPGNNGMKFIADEVIKTLNN